jgi:2-polyprenyl-3-methyl-5-hydroxy-6-metoxy-1,4-benzoquinol methylase
MPSERLTQEEQAVAEHSRTADLFRQRYTALEADPFVDAFAYSRMRLDRAIRAELPEPRPGMRLLDVGCGTGHQLRNLNDAGFAVTGVDGSEDMLAHARELNPGAELRQANVDALPFPDASFDVVICLEVLRYLPDPQPCLSEIRRVLRPGGKALVTATPLFNLNGYAIVNRLALVVQQDSFTRLKQFFVTPGRLTTRFNDAGFSRVAIHGVYVGPINWIERLVPTKLPAFLRRWQRIDERLSDRPVIKHVSNMYLVHAAVQP